MRVLFMGTPAFALPTLAAVAEAHQLVGVVTRPDKARGRGRKTSFSEVKDWAVVAGAPIEQPATLRDADVQQRLAAYRPDVVVVAAYGLILPPAVLQLPPHGCINVHASLLPRHRGAAPIAWAILSGDQETGVTIMQMDEGLDTGPMLARRVVPLLPDDTSESLTPRLAELGAELLVETLARVADGSLAPEPQPDEGATLAPSFKKHDGALDWLAAAVDVDRRVRALQPWPGTFTFRNGERLAVWRVRPVAGDPDAAPGTIIAVHDAGFRVACGVGAVEVLELQRAGGKRQTAAEFLRGHPLSEGERLGPAPDAES